MIPDVYLWRSLYLIKSGPGLRTHQAWRLLIYYQEAFVILVILTFLKIKLTFAQERNLSCIQQSFYPYRHIKVLKGDTLHTSTSGWSARRSTIWIIHTLVGRSTLLYTYVYQKKRRTTSQWRRQFNEKVDCVGWFKRLIQKVNSKGWSKKLIRKLEGWFGRLGRQVTDD